MNFPKGFPKEVFLEMICNELATLMGYSDFDSLNKNADFICVNLNNNKILQTYIELNSPVRKLSLTHEKNFDSMIKAIAYARIIPSDVDVFIEYFNRDNLINKFEQGINYGNLAFMAIKNEKYVWVHATYVIHKVDDIYVLYCYFYEFDNYQKRMDKIKNMAEVDQLTNVYNRYMLEKVLDKFINQDLNTSGAIALMDIDDFKYVNDTFGHVKGDDVLKKTANKLLKIFNHDYEYVFRFGGDEFVVLSTSPSESFLDKLKLFIKDPIFINDHKITNSIGYLKIHSKKCDKNAIISKADEALYKSKRNGKNRISEYLGC